MLEYFEDWAKTIGTFYEKATSKDSQGRTVETWTERTTETVNFWTETSMETNSNDKFVDNAVGVMLVRPDLEVTNKYKFVADGVDYFITGVDDVGGLGEFKRAGWKREY